MYVYTHTYIHRYIHIYIYIHSYHWGTWTLGVKDEGGVAWVFRFGCFGDVDFGDLELQVFRRVQSLGFRVRVWGLSTVFDGITCPLNHGATTQAS